MPETNGPSSDAPVRCWHRVWSVTAAMAILKNGLRKGAVLLRDLSDAIDDHGGMVFEVEASGLRWKHGRAVLPERIPPSAITGVSALNTIRPSDEGYDQLVVELARVAGLEEGGQRRKSRSEKNERGS